jgi:hypothetical protein
MDGTYRVTRCLHPWESIVTCGVLAVYFPDIKQNDALDFMTWVRNFQPLFTDVMAAVISDGLFWRTGSIDAPTSISIPTSEAENLIDAAFGKVIITPNDNDLKFLKSLRIKWSSDEEVEA